MSTTTDVVDQTIDWLAENDPEELRDLAHSLAAEVRVLSQRLAEAPR